MKPRYLAFDIETAQEIPGDGSNWRAHRPLGICCAATLTSDSADLTLFHGRMSKRTHAPRMSRKEAAELVEHLAAMAKAGYTILTWNGLGFDFDILAEESADPTACRACALD